MHHFLDLSDIPAEQLRIIVDRAKTMKQERAAGKQHKLLPDRKLVMIFEKNSTRTRVSFEAGILELGGYAICLNSNDTQLGRGETIADTARVLSRYADIIMLRCHSHDTLGEMARHSTVPIINGLSDRSHPCQILADIMTYEEHRGGIAGKKVAWVGDGNNVCASYITAAAAFGFSLGIACPPELAPDTGILAWAGNKGADIRLCQSPQEAAENADLVVTDTWVSMGDADAAKRMSLLRPYQVSGALMARARKDALFMHCLPAHRDEEVTGEVIDGPQSIVWDEAENRLHIQKAIMLWCKNAL